MFFQTDKKTELTITSQKLTTSLNTNCKSYYELNFTSCNCHSERCTDQSTLNTSVTRQGRTNESEIKSFKMIIKTVLGC